MDYAALIQAAIAMYGQQKASQMTGEQLDLLKQQLENVQNVPLPQLQQQQADQLGNSAVGDMQSDQGLRTKQLQAIATLQNIIDKGGLDLSDQAALEQAISASTNEQKRARAGVAASAAARGQMNSGNRLLMDMDAAQSGANTARQTGLQTAAQAQQRKLAAIQEAAGLTGNLRTQDWQEAQTANAAKDLRDERNAAAREKAQYYNAGLAQQGFSNAMAKATGQQPATNAMAQGLDAAAAGVRADAAGMAGVAGQLPSYAPSSNSPSNSYSYNPDLYGDRGGAQDIAKSEDDK